MKKLIITSVIIILAIFQTNAQQFLTKNGKISFYSDGPLEKIEAHNSQVNSALNIKTGEIVFKILIKSFLFEKALMQEHFNENYLESDKFPTSILKGKIVVIEEIDFSKNGIYEADIEGDLTIHGVTNKVKEKGIFTVSENSIQGESKFFIKLDDYDISIPGAVTGKIAEKIEVSVDIALKPYKK